MVSKQSCGVCAKVVGVDHPEAGIQVSCDGPCGKAFHLLCADLSMPFLHARTAKVGLLWFCKLCRLEFDEGVRHRDSALQIAMREMFEKVHDSIKGIASRVDAVDENLLRLNQVVETIKCGKSTLVGEDVLPGTSTHIEKCVHSEQVVDSLPDSKEHVISRVDKTDFCTDEGKFKKAAVDPKIEKKSSTKIWAAVFNYLDFEDLCRIRLVNSKWKNIVDTERSLMNKFEMLTHLKFTVFDMSLVNLMEMLQKTPNLRLLSLNCVSDFTYTTAVEKYSDLRLENLKSLTLNTVEQTEVVEVFLRMCPQLTDVRLQELGVVKEELFSIKTGNSMEGISLKAPFSVLAKVKHSWKSVSLIISYNESGKFNEDLISFSASQTSLESLDLHILGYSMTEIDYNDYNKPRYGYRLDDKTLIKVFQNLNLSRLSLRLWWKNCFGVSVLIDLKHVLSCLKKLEYFAFDGVHSPPISLCGVKCPKLKELHLSNTTISNALPKISCFWAEFGLQECIESAKDLHTITLNKCTLYSWYHLFVPTQMKELRCLKLTKVKVKDSFYDHGFKGCFVQLRCLHLNNCYDSMAGSILCSMFQQCPQMEELHLSEINANEHVGLVLGQWMPMLRKLTLDNCPITDFALKYIVEHCRSLSHLTITRCRNISSAVKVWLMEEARIAELKVE